MRRLGLAVAAVIAAWLAATLPALPEEGAAEIKSLNWSFNGIAGSFDRPALRRGLEVFLNVCSSCHSLKYVSYRNLVDLGLSVDEAKEIAGRHQITDGPDDQGEMFYRPGILADHFVPPFANEKAARFAMNGALPPDLSLMAKARKRGPDYIYSVLIGFVDPPAGVEPVPGMFYNAAFPGHAIAMPPPLADGLLDYADGTKATVEQMAMDVVQFLEWTAEPKLEDRKRLGIGVMIFLVILAGLLFAVKRRVWSDVQH